MEYRRAHVDKLGQLGDPDWLIVTLPENVQRRGDPPDRCMLADEATDPRTMRTFCQPVIELSLDAWLEHP